MKALYIIAIKASAYQVVLKIKIIKVLQLGNISQELCYLIKD